MRPYVAELARIAESYVTCHPNAGLPNAFGEYDELPDDTAALLREFAEAGVRQHRRRLLRDDAGAHPRDRETRLRDAAAARDRRGGPIRRPTRSRSSRGWRR